MFLHCDYSIYVQLIPNSSAKMYSNNAKSVTISVKFEIEKREWKYSSQNKQTCGKIGEQLRSNLAGSLAKWIKFNKISQQLVVPPILHIFINKAQTF